MTPPHAHICQEIKQEIEEDEQTAGDYDKAFVLVYDQEEWKTAIHLPYTTICVVPTKIFCTDDGDVCGFELRFVSSANMISLEFFFYFLDGLIPDADTLFPEPEADTPVDLFKSHVAWIMQGYKEECYCALDGGRCFEHTRSFIIENVIRCQYTQFGIVQTIAQDKALSAALLKLTS